MRKLAVVILAAGRGTRMKSELPKALHELDGQPMLGHLLSACSVLKPDRVIVVAGFRADLVRRYVAMNPWIAAKKLDVVVQKQLLGSGHAVNQAAQKLSGFDGATMVLYCDTPLISPETLKSLVQGYYQKDLSGLLLSVRFENPTGYGRIERKSDGSVARIVEENDADSRQKAIREVNVGAYVFDTKKLFSALKLVRQNPAKKEYYLTDAVGILADQGMVGAILTGNSDEVAGVNSKADLARLEAFVRQKNIEQWIEEGVKIRDPKTTFIDADVKIGVGTVIHANTVIEEGSVIGKDCSIGPFARIRGGSQVGDGSTVGNFVEVVRSRIGRKTYVKHLTYLGDAVVGSFVNIGAGTITANYDGKKKHKTVIRDKAQIGSGTILIAPITVGQGAKTGAGAVVTKGKNIPNRGVFVGMPARAVR